MNALDLTFLSIYRINSQEWPLLPGLLAQNPPKKLARGRNQDRLLIYLTLAGNVSYSTSQYSEIVGRVAETFYNTPGALTFALKTATLALNTTLVQSNMKSTGKGLYSIGALVLCNLRGNSMYIVQAGPTHVYHLAGELRHLYDPQLAGKGLGLSQTARMYFSQVMLSAGDRLLMCAALPKNWDKAIDEAHGSTSLEIIRRRLLAITDTNVSALLVHASDGSGAMNMLKAVQDEPPEPATSAVAPPIDPATPLSVLIDKAPALDSPSTGQAPALKGIKQALETAEQAAKDSQSPMLETAQAVEPQPASENYESAPERQPFREPRTPIQTEMRAGLKRGLRATARFLAHLIQKERALVQKLSAWGQKTIPRLLPENDEDQLGPSLSRTWSIFFAIAIPVLFLVVARVVYYQLGYDAQYKTYFNRAQQAAQQALAVTSPTALRVEWQAALDWLDRADQYQRTPNADAQKLRQDAQAALDNLDKVVRLDFSPAFNTNLSRNLQVSRMSASDSAIYLLDSTRGSVMRGVFNSQNYDLDGSFQCGPGTYDEILVDKLVDIVVLPLSKTTNATVLGIDASGNLLYCIPGEPPHAVFLQMPESGWKGITSIAYDAYNLYVLDAPARAVWVYLGTDQVEFAEKPFFFFESQVPIMLEEAIGIAINGDDLYLLHQDGHLAACTFSHISTAPTRCNDPALYIDTRPGYEGGMNLGDGIFTQIAFTSPPDLSVALLEPFTQSIYRFSPRALELQNQVRAGFGKNTPLPKGLPVTAMAFSPNKMLFIFVDGQVYFAVNVP